MRTLLPRNRADLDKAAKVVAGLSPDKPWRIQISGYREKRSAEQNSLLWAIYSEISRETGNDAETIHAAMKAKFLPPVRVSLGDDNICLPGSSAKLDVREFSDFLERVQAFAASELGIVVLAAPCITNNF